MSSKKRKKNAKRVRRARKLAKTLPRDKRGKFLPRGSKNLFKKKRKRSKSVPVKNRRAKTKKARRKSVGSKGKGMGSRTGGTGDVKPQILTLSTGIAPAINDYVTATSVLPVPRFGTNKTKATIFELLWVDWYLALEDLAASLATQWAWLSTVATRSTADVSTLTTMVADISDPRTFGLAFTNHVLITEGSRAPEGPIRINLTDNNGNGILVATDRLQITGGNAAGGTPGTYIAKVGYRLTNVGIQEYVGIVTSQQGTGIA